MLKCTFNSIDRILSALRISIKELRTLRDLVYQCKAWQGHSNVFNFEAHRKSPGFNRTILFFTSQQLPLTMTKTINGIYKQRESFDLATSFISTNWQVGQ